jgi:hypothetical protein
MSNLSEAAAQYGLELEPGKTTEVIIKGSRPVKLRTGREAKNHKVLGVFFQKKPTMV